MVIPFMNLLPEIALILMIGVLFVRTLLEKRIHHPITSHLMLVLAVLPAVAAWITLDARASLFHETYKIDLLSQVFKLTIGAVLFVIISLCHKFSSISVFRRTEFFIFLCTSALGMMMLASAVELLTFYIALELTAYSTYVMVPLNKEKKSAEAAIKYVIFGACMSGLLVYGISLLVGVTQTTYLFQMQPQAPFLAGDPVFLLAVILILAALFFKLSAFPFHFWAPDAYEAAPTEVTALIATASKTSAIVILLRILSHFGLPEMLIPVLTAMAFLSMFAGNCAALLQKDVKRLFAYSSIAQAGYLLIALASADHGGLEAVMFYAIVYALMNAAAFMVIIEVGRDSNTSNPDFHSFNGLADRNPLLALLLLCSILSLAGIPPFAGFTGKWILFLAAMKANHPILVLLAVINSVVSLYYYLGLVKHAYLNVSNATHPFKKSLRTDILAIALLLLLLVIGIYPTPLLTLVQQAI